MAVPHGVTAGSLSRGPDGGAEQNGSPWPVAQGLAGSVPGWTTLLYQSRYLSDGGRLFFDSPDALVAQDTNNVEDVYEWEPVAGEGTPPGDTCTVSSPGYSPVSGGCVGLDLQGQLSRTVGVPRRLSQR